MQSRRPPKVVAFAALALFCVLFAPCRGTRPCLAAEAGRPESVTVVMDDNYPPYVFRAADGRVQGLLIDEWALWSEKTGVQAELVATDWDKAQQIMAEGRADVIDTIFFNQTRAKTLDFTKAYATLAVPVFHHKSLSGITDVASLKGFTVAVKAGDACIDVLRAGGIDTLREYGSYEEIIKAAAAGEIKVFTVDEPPAMYYLAKFGLEDDYRYAFTLYSGQFHRAVAKGRSDLLALVESGFAAITPSERESLRTKWLGAPLTDGRFYRILAYGLGLVGAGAVLLAFFNYTLRRRVRAKTNELGELMRELAKSEERYRLLFEMESDAILLMAMPGGAILEANSAACQLYGYEPEEMRTLNRADLSVASGPPSPALPEGGGATVRWHRRKNGELFAVEIASRRFELHGQQLRLAAVRDVTERLRTQTALVESRKLLETILNTVPQAIFWKDVNSVFLGCNAVFARDLGLDDPSQVVGKTDKELALDPGDIQLYLHADREVMVSGVPKSRVVEQIRRSGASELWIETNKMPLVGDDGTVFGVLGVYTDITERKLYEERIESSLREKEVLLKEVHHRVKNNLQILSSLINLQAQGLANGCDIEAFRVMQNRVRSISMVHESLYRSPDLGAVGMKEYLPGLAEQVLSAYGEAARNIRLEVEVDDLSLGVDKGIPLGLLVTELLTNAVKHAFAPGSPGHVRLDLRCDDGACRLAVEDDGVGLPEDFSLDGSQTLGVQLLTALSAQLRGSLRIAGAPGGVARFEVDFPA